MYMAHTKHVVIVIECTQRRECVNNGVGVYIKSVYTIKTITGKVISFSEMLLTIMIGEMESESYETQRR